MTRSTDPDVLEQNVTTLLESGGETPKLTDIARARIRAELVAKHASHQRAAHRAGAASDENRFVLEDHAAFLVSPASSSSIASHSGGL